MCAGIVGVDYIDENGVRILTGGKLAASKNLAKNPNFYHEIGAKGGRNSANCGVLIVKGMTMKILENNDYEVLSAGMILGKNGTPMKPQTDDKGYLRVQIRTPEKCNGVTTLKVHRVVASAFIPNIDNLPQVDHIDGDKTNNDVSNLEWVTNEENQRRAKDRGVYNNRTPDNIKLYASQILSAINRGYIAKELFELNGVECKTFWSYIDRENIQEEPISTIQLGRKRAFYYYDKNRNKWRVERSDYIQTGKQFATEQEASEYAQRCINAGGFAKKSICSGKCGLNHIFGEGHTTPQCLGAKGGRISRRKAKTTV